jgi:hypothetical protein
VGCGNDLGAGTGIDFVVVDVAVVVAAYFAVAAAYFVVGCDVVVLVQLVLVVGYDVDDEAVR